MIFLGVLGGDPLGEWGMAKTKTEVFWLSLGERLFPSSVSVKFNLVRGRIIGAK